MSPEQERLLAVVVAQRRFVRRALARRVQPRDLDDATQETLLRATRSVLAGRFEAAPEGDLEDAVRGWLYGVVHHVVIHLKRNVEPTVVLVDTVPDADPVPRLEAREQLRVMGYRLARDERRLLNEIGQGARLADVAAALRLPRGTVATRLRALRVTLRKRLPR